MDKRLDKLLKSGAEFTDGCMIDTYNQQVQKDTACTIRTNINTANHHYIVERDTEMKGNYEEPMIIDDVYPGREKRVYKEVAPVIRSGHDIMKVAEPMFVERDTEMKGNYEETRICSMVGRGPNNPKSRKKSEEYVQMVELGNDVSNTLTTVQKDNLVAEPLIIQQATKQGYVEVQPGSVFDASFPESKTRRGRLQDNGQTTPTLMASGEPPCFYEGKIEEPNVLTSKRTEYGKKMRKAYESGDVKMSRHDFQEMRPRTDGVSNTITSVEKDNYLAETRFRIRKLTERECFRLMGVGDNEIDKIQASGVSRSQQYKMAGNSIVVDVLFHLFRKLFAEKGCESEQLSLF